MGIGTIFNVILVNPTINFLLLFLFIFTTWNIPGAFGWAIISLTIAIRLLLNPLFAKQMKTARDIEMLRPKLAGLNEKHKNDKQRLQQEQLKLYQEHGINPASGCVTGLIQMPIFISLYRVLQLFLTHDVSKILEHVNGVAYTSLIKISSINPWFFGINLAETPSHFRTLGWYYLLIPVITGILQYYQISMQTPGQPAKKDAIEVKDTKKKGDDKDKKNDGDDMQAAMAKQMKIMFPLMIGYFSYTFPVGLALYWNIFSLFSIITSRKPKTWNIQK